MSDYSYFSRAELMQVLLHNKTELNKQKVKTEPTDTPGKKILTDIKKQLENEIKAIEAKLKETAAQAPVAAAPEATPAGEQTLTLANEQALMKSMKEQSIIQNLLDVIRTVTKMATGDSMEKFVAEMDQIYQVEVEGQLDELPQLEDEFVRGTKRLLPHVMFSQLSKSGEDTSKWDTLKKYLIKNHGSKITMFQHLTRLWNLEAKPEDKLTDFGAKLEEETHTAAMHIKELFTKKHSKQGQQDVQMSADDVFKLMAAMLASIQVRKNHEDIFKAMIKKMDTHWTASSLVADAQDYVDRLGATNNVTKTGAEIAFVAKSKNSKSSDQKKSSVKKATEDESAKAIKELQKQNEVIHKAIKSLTLTNSSSKTGGRNLKLSNTKWRNAKSRFNNGKPIHEQICFKFNQGKCKGNECPDGRRHLDDHVARVAVEEAEMAAAGSNNELDSLFQLGPGTN